MSAAVSRLRLALQWGARLPRASASGTASKLPVPALPPRASSLPIAPFFPQCDRMICRFSLLISLALVLLEIYLASTSTSVLSMQVVHSRRVLPVKFFEGDVDLNTSTSTTVRGVPAVGTPWAPCTGRSSYVHKQLNIMYARVMADAGDNDAATCSLCLGSSNGGVGQVSYCDSQFGQDLFLFNNFFSCLDEPGVYIDAGAHLPRHLSTTFAFDKCLNWKGLAVEADNAYAAQFGAQRTCEVVGAALAEFEGTLELGQEGASSSTKDGRRTGSGQTVRATTLTRVLHDLKWINKEATPPSEPFVIDFLTIDVEGAELGVLMGVPWDHVWIRYILAENVGATHDVEEYLIDIGYVKIYSLAVDDLYFKASAIPLQRAANIDYHRRTTSVTRKNGNIPTYDTQPLYTRGWEHVKIMTHETGHIPLE